MKYDVKNEHGQLTYGSFQEVYVLYQRRFVSDDDMVRRHGTDRWIPAGLMPELRGSRDLVKDRSTPVYATVLGMFFVSLGVLLVKTHTVGLGTIGFWLGALFAVASLTGLAYYFRKRARLVSAQRTLAGAELKAAVSPFSATGTSHGQGSEER